MRMVAAMLVLAACGKSENTDTPPPSPPPAAKPRLRAIAEVKGATLVAGWRHVIIATPDRWLVADGTALKDLVEVADQVTKLRAELGELELFAAAAPVVVGGAEHHEETLRLGSGPIEVPGHLQRMTAFADGTEVWQYEERLRARLALVSPTNKLTPLPGLALTAPAIEGDSPVRTKQCATPAIEDLASTGTTVAALVVECNPAARVRIVKLDAKGAQTVDVLESPEQLGFAPKRLALAPNGAGGIVGIAGGKLAVRKGSVTTTSLANLTVLVSVAISDDGAIWALTLADDRAQVSRDGEVIAIANRTGAPMRPVALALDSSLGIVVLATTGDTAWVWSER
jgi:hypothetical protein